MRCRLCRTSLLLRVSSFYERPTLSTSLKRDLFCIDKWRTSWDMLINLAKTYDMMILRSKTARPTLHDLLIGCSYVKIASELKILGDVFDSKLTFKSCDVCCRLLFGLVYRKMNVFSDNYIASCCFWSFILTVLEYCSPAWMSTALPLVTD